MDSVALSTDGLFDLAQRQAQAAALERKLAPAPRSKSDARRVAEDFEAVFLTTMLENMFAGIDTGGPFGGGYGETVYRSLLNEHYAAAIVKSGGIGIADSIYREILKLQDISQTGQEKR